MTVNKDDPDQTMNFASIIEQLAPGAEVLRSARLAGGVSAEVHEVVFVAANGNVDRVVVRRHRNIDGKPDRRERAAREHALLGVLHARGLPVPRSRMFVPPDTLVLDMMEGSTTLPDDPVKPLAVALAGIHAIAGPAGLPALPVLDDPLPGLLAWRPDLLAGDAARLHCAAYAGTPHLLHGDYWPGNVLWQGSRLVAVLDWEDAAIGDPLADVACARVELCCMRDVQTAERFTAAYGEHAALDSARLSWWDLYVSTAALQYMNDWGLAADVLAARRAATAAWQAQALRRIRTA